MSGMPPDVLNQALNAVQVPRELKGKPGDVHVTINVNGNGPVSINNAPPAAETSWGDLGRLALQAGVPLTIGIAAAAFGLSNVSATPGS